MRLFLVLGFVALLLSGCEAPPPMKTKTNLHEMSTETKKSIAEQSKDASDAAKETSFGDKESTANRR